MFLITHLLRFSVRHPRPVITVVGVITVCGLIFIPRIRLRLDGRSLIPSNLPEFAVDLLFGRKVLKFFFNPYVFVGLAQRSGINMKFLSKKATGRLKAQGGAKDVVDFDGHAIAVIDEIAEWTLGPGTFDEIFYNWVRPTSMIESFRKVKYPDFDERAT